MIYADNNATTRLAPEALAAMTPFLTECYANPSSPYHFARAASAALVSAREYVAALIGADPPEVVFTSGGTESNNAALDAALTLRPGRRRILISAVEHPSVTRAAGRIAARDGEAITVPVDRQGRLDLGFLASALDDRTALVSVMTANNETGAVCPVAEIADLAHRHGALMHTDAVQAAGKLPLAARDTGVDLLSLSAHKFHGPKGVGCLYVRSSLSFPPFLRGGGQERGRRAGTENVAGIAGMGAAAALAGTGPALMENEIRVLRDGIERHLLAAVPGAKVTAAEGPRLPNTSLVIAPAGDSETMLGQLDRKDICCSSGSACAAGSPEPSPVLLAMGIEPAAARRALRITLSRYTTADEAQVVAQAVADVMTRAR